MKALVILISLLCAGFAQEVPLNGIATRGDVSVYLSTGLVSCQTQILPFLFPRNHQAQCGLMVSIKSTNPSTAKFAVTTRVELVTGEVQQYDAIVVADPKDFATTVIWTGGFSQRVSKVLTFDVAEVQKDQIKSFAQ